MLLQVGMQCREVLMELGQQLVDAHLQGGGAGEGHTIFIMYDMHIGRYE